MLMETTDGTYGDFKKIPILPPTHPLRKLNNKKNLPWRHPPPFFQTKSARLLLDFIAVLYILELCTD